jgi:hypothetical protein
MHVNIYNIIKILDKQKKEFTMEADNLQPELHTAYLNTIHTLLMVAVTTPKYLISGQVSAVEPPREEPQALQ